MRIILRADGNSDLGMGHIFRCLTLANELKDRHSNYEILFISKYEDGQRIIAEMGFGVVGTQKDEVLQIRKLAGSGTLLITDFLDTDNFYLSRIKSATDIKIIAIDNNTRIKTIDADVVINANVFDEGESRIIDSTMYYLGPKYMTLRREFDAAHKVAKEIKDRVGVILIMSGGADSTKESLILNSVKTLAGARVEATIHLVVGPVFQQGHELDRLMSKVTGRFKVYSNPQNVTEIMRGADMAVTAAGISLYELAACGIPCIVVPQVTRSTSHQEDIAAAFDQRGACVNLGRSPSNLVLEEKTIMLMEDKSLRKRLSENAKALVDGKGLGRALRIIRGIMK